MIALAFALFACGLNRAYAQECPRVNPNGPNIVSRVQTLTGRLVYHDDIRGYLELELDRPRCGESSIQLLQFDQQDKHLETLRGCRVRSTGSMDISSTGYIVLNTFQNVKEIEPIGACSLQPRFPDYS